MTALRKAAKELGLEVALLTDFRVRIPPGGRTTALVETVITWRREGRPRDTFTTLGVDSDQLAAAVIATEKMLNALASRRRSAVSSAPRLRPRRSLGACSRCACATPEIDAALPPERVRARDHRGARTPRARRHLPLRARARLHRPQRLPQQPAAPREPRAAARRRAARGPSRRRDRVREGARARAAARLRPRRRRLPPRRRARARAARRGAAQRRSARRAARGGHGAVAARAREADGERTGELALPDADAALARFEERAAQLEELARAAEGTHHALRGRRGDRARRPRARALFHAPARRAARRRRARRLRARARGAAPRREQARRAPSARARRSLRRSLARLRREPSARGPAASIRARSATSSIRARGSTRWSRRATARRRRSRPRGGSRRSSPSRCRSTATGSRREARRARSRRALLRPRGALACATPAALPEGPPIGAPRPPRGDRAGRARPRRGRPRGRRARGRPGSRDATRSTSSRRAERELRPDGPPTGLVPAGFEAADAVRCPGRAGLAAHRAPARARRRRRRVARAARALARRRSARARAEADRRGALHRGGAPVQRGVGAGRAARSSRTTLLPFTLGSALAHYSIDFVRDDALPLQRRQALAHWQRFVREYPDAPEVAELAPEIEEYQAAWRETQADRARDLAEDALDDGLPDAAWFYARRARRYVDERGRARARGARPSSGSRAPRALAQRDDVRRPGRRRGARGASAARCSRRSAARAASPRHRADARSPTRSGSCDADALGRAGDDGGDVASRSRSSRTTPESPMARHAQALRSRSGAQSVPRVRARALGRALAHDALGAVRSAHRARPIAARSASLDYLLDLPWRIQGATLLPIRLIQLPWRESTPGAAETAVHARRYLAANPARRARATRCATGSRSSSAIARTGSARCASPRAAPDASDAELDVLRERAAEQALRVATGEKRSDLRARLLANVVRTFPETRAGARGRPRRARAGDRAHRALGAALARLPARESRASRGRAGSTSTPRCSTTIRATASCIPTASRWSAVAS